LIRSQIHLNYNIPSDFVFKLAETEEELTAAFYLLHESYVQQGYMEPQLSHLRATFFHLLPSTCLLIAKKGERVIATVSIIRDSAHGLPLEKDFDLSYFRNEGRKISEISSLAVADEYRSSHGFVLFPLLKFMYNYCKNYFATDVMVLATHPKLSDLFEAILLFKPIEDKVIENYGFANGAPAVGKYLDLKLAPMMYAAHYGLKTKNKNLYHFMVPQEIGGVDFPQIKFPKRNDFRLFDTLIANLTFENIFVNKTSILNQIDERQAKFLISQYGRNLNPNTLVELKRISKIQEERMSGPRFEVECPAQIHLSDEDYSSAKVTNISESGLSCEGELKLRVDHLYKMKVALSQFEVCEIKVKCVWKSGRNYGLKIEDTSDLWMHFIDRLVSPSDEIKMAA